MKKGDRRLPLFRVLNPLGQPAEKETPSSDGWGRAPRLDTIDGKTIYLVDVGFGGGYEFLEEMRRWLSENQPAVTTVLRRKRGNMFLDDPALWAEIKARGDAVILGVGG